MEAGKNLFSASKKICKCSAVVYFILSICKWNTNQCDLQFFSGNFLVRILSSYCACNSYILFALVIIISRYLAVLRLLALTELLVSYFVSK